MFGDFPSISVVLTDKIIKMNLKLHQNGSVAETDVNTFNKGIYSMFIVLETFTKCLLVSAQR